jgi:hypothetical protein
MFKCKHCDEQFINFTTSQKANHSRWCDKNPKKQEYLNNLNYARYNIKNPRNQFIKARQEGRNIPVGTMTGKPGTFKGKTHTSATKQIISEKALLSKHRRLLRSIREYTKLDGTKVILDSSWEEALAVRLDELEIVWIRPDTPISYISSDGKTRNYFPDFYLPDYNLYLDPKNPFAIRVQQDKLNIVKGIMCNLIIIDNLNDCKNFTL